MVTFLFNGNVEKTRALVKQGVRDGWLREVGEVQLRELGGNKAKAYVARGLRVKPSWVLHDTMLHAWRLRVPNAKVTLGYDCDPEFRADGEVAFSNGTEGMLEMDMETESLSKVMKRLAEHKAHGKPVFFITLSEPRIKKLRHRIKDELSLDAQCLLQLRNRSSGELFEKYQIELENIRHEIGTIRRESLDLLGEKGTPGHE